MISHTRKGIDEKTASLDSFWRVVQAFLPPSFFCNSLLAELWKLSSHWLKVSPSYQQTKHQCVVTVIFILNPKQSTAPVTKKKSNSIPAQKGKQCWWTRQFLASHLCLGRDFWDVRHKPLYVCTLKYKQPCICWYIYPLFTHLMCHLETKRNPSGHSSESQLLSLQKLCCINVPEGGECV